MSLQTLMLGVAVGFAFVNGVNDGGSVLAVGLNVRSIRPLTGILVLTVFVMAAPVLLGTGVANTLAGDLVSFDGRTGRIAILIAVIVAMTVSFLLARKGLPTSLTMALVGAIAGVGVGAGLDVTWSTVWFVLTLAVVAPLVGVLVGWGLTRAVAMIDRGAPLTQHVDGWHQLGFGVLCLAYGANDGQKMLAVMAVAAGTTDGGVEVVAWQLAAIGAAFLVGAVVGLPRFAATLGGGVVPNQPPDAVLTELSSASVVLGSSAFGAPVSMTQAIAGAQVGTGVVRGHGRVRWRAAARIVGAWMITLPAAFGTAMLVATAVV